MSATFYNVGRRYLARHPWQTALMILGIALGVAVMVAIDLANSAASRAFDLSTEAITGKATHQVSGGPAGLPEKLYAELKTSGVFGAAAPVVTDYVSSPQLGGRPLQLLGVDPFAEAPFRSYLATEQTGSVESPADVGSLVTFLTRPGGILISEDLANEYGLQLGSSVELNASGRTTAGAVVGLLRPQDGLTRRALQGIILVDIATAQEMLGWVGRLSYIDLILDSPREASAIAASLPAGVRVAPVAARSGAVEQMTAAFRVNLTALSLLALVVGMFLIYNTMTFSVVQRRPLFGTLRSLGVTRAEVARLVLAEAALVGLVGSLLGLGLGIILGQGAVRLVTQTINDLYFVLNVRGIAIAAESLVRGMVLGIAATVASAAIPAWEASTVPPRAALTRSVLEDKARRAIPGITLAGLIALAAGGGLLAIPTRSLAVSFAGIFFVTIGFALLARS